jgi:hypothetical protein
MNGQGKPLPPIMGLEGEWVVEGYVFIYHSRSGRVPQAMFTMRAERHDGDLCLGFDSEQLAATLDVDVDTLIEANQAQTLIALGVADVMPTHGGRSAKAYGFRIGDREGFLTIEIDQQEGTA